MDSIKQLLENLKTFSSATDLIESVTIDQELREKIESNYYTSEDLKKIVYSLQLSKYETSKLLDAIDQKRTESILEAVLQSKKGQYFETLFALCILMGVSKWGKDIVFYKGNSNKKQFEEIKDFREVLEKSASSGNTGGWSDISFYDLKSEKTIISTSKYYKNDEYKPVDAYEIHKLGTLSNNDRDRDYSFALFCKNKINFQNRWNNSNKSTQIGNIGLEQFNPEQDVYDLTDLDIWCKSLITLLDLYSWDYEKIKNEWFENDREILVPMYHQIVAYNEMKKWKSTGGTEYLLAHKPRAGKTVTTALYCIEEKPKNVLLLTNLPCLNSQWKETFYKYEGLSYYINDVSGDKLKSIDMSNTYSMVMLSFQDLKINEWENEKFNNIRDVEWDLVIIDEVHFGKETLKSDYILSKLEAKFLIGLSATPTKNLLRGTFSRENTHFWASEQEIEQKKIEIARKKDGMYSQYPDLEHYVYSPPKILRQKLSYYSEEENLTFHKFLSVNNGEFKYKKDVEDFFTWLRGGFGNDKTAPFKIFNPKSILVFVDSISQQEPIKRVLDNDPWFSTRYNTYLTNSKINDSKNLMLEVQNNFIPKGDMGSIIIAVDQLRTGVTLKECDTVMFLNDISSMDNYIQAGYRCQSPSRGKEKCRTIDFLPGRMFNILNDFVMKSSYIKGEELSVSQRKMLDCVPIFECIEGDLKQIDFVDFKKRIYYNVDIGKNLIPYYSIEKIDNQEVEKLSSFVRFTSTKEVLNQELNEDEEFKIQKGKNYVSQGKTNKKQQEKSKSNYEIARENLIHILNRLSLASVFTDYKYDDIDSLLDAIEVSKETFGKRTLNVKKWFLDSFDMDISVFQIKRLIKKTCNINIINSRIQAFNWNMKRMITPGKNQDLKQAVNFLSKYVVSSKKDIYENGDVQTPFWIVDKMINQLDDTFFENKYNRVLDPCVGFGQFPVVIIDKFMRGLENQIPSELERKKYILENIIYAVDIAPKYTYIYNQIFNYNDDYELNIKTGSYLSINTFKEFGIYTFNLIATNPPHSKSKTGKVRGTLSIYDKFITKFAKEAENVISLTPAKWFTKNQKQIKIFRENMLNKWGLKSLFYKKKLFDNIQVNSGFCYFHLERSYKDQVNFMGKQRTFDDIITFVDLSKIKDKFKHEKRLGEIYNTEKYFGIKNTDSRFLKQSNENTYKCHVSKRHGSVVYVDKNTIEPTDNIHTYKVLLSSASGSRKNIKEISNPIIAYPNEVCSRSYIHLAVSNKTQAESLKSYLETRFAKRLIGEVKQTHVLSKAIFDNLPMVPLDRIWTDEKLYEYFKLSIQEINLIEYGEEF